MATALNELVHTVCRAAAADRLSAEPDAALLDRLHPVWDAAAFEVLVRRHSRTVLAAGRSVLRDDADVHDAFQATFLVLLRNAKTVRRGLSLSRWLYGVARKVALKARARAVAVGKREAKAAKPERHTDVDPGWRETCDLLVRELARLPESFRRPLELCYFDGLTREEAAAALGVSTGAVRGRLERGRELLRTRLEGRGVSLSVGMLALALVNSAAAVSPRLIQSVLSAASGSASPTVAALVEGFAMTGFKGVMSVLVACAVGFVGLAWVGLPAAARPDDKPAMKADAPKAKAEKPKTAKTVSGVVVGPDGKPVAGATLELKTASASLVKDHEAKPIGVSDADGKFKVDVPNGALHFWLLARKDGLGVAWLEPEYPTGAMPADNVTLQLVKDFPITGRVLDTEGKPVAGVTVAVRDVIEPLNRDLDKLLKGSANGGFGQAGQWQKVLFEPVKPATTDKDGKFVIAGMGADRIVGIAVHGKGVARISGFVFTRAGVDVAALNEKPRGPVRRVGDHPVLYPANPTFVVGAGYALAGVVTNKATGKPIPDCEVQVNAGFWDDIRVRTDAAGRYTLDGLTKGMDHHVHVTPTSAAGVFGTWKTISRTDVDKPLSLDFALAKGAIFKGKVIDKETKEVVRASFQILPTGDNDYVKRPEYETAARSMVWHGGSEDAFRITTVPGKSRVNINVVPMKTLHGQPYHPYRAEQSLEIDLPEDGEKDHVIEIDRGKTAVVSVVDEAGKPMTGLTVSGITHTNQDGVDQPRIFKLSATEGPFTVYGLGQKEKRRLIVLQPDKKLVGTMLVGADAKETLTLVPLQPLTGCFTDTDGKPLAGLTVGIDYEGYGEGPLVGEAGGFVLTAKTDADGKFAIPAVVPGLPFTFNIRKGNTNYGGVPKLGKKTVEAGKLLDIGKRKLEILD